MKLLYKCITVLQCRANLHTAMGKTKKANTKRSSGLKTEAADQDASVEKSSTKTKSPAEPRQSARRSANLKDPEIEDRDEDNEESTTKKKRQSTANASSKRKSTSASASSSKKSKKADDSKSGSEQEGSGSASAASGSRAEMKARSIQLNKTLASMYDSDPPKRSNAYTMKLISWNINGLKSFLKKPDSMAYLLNANADFVAMQEIKCDARSVPNEARSLLKGYTSHFASAEKAGYAGTAVYTKQTPVKVTSGLGEKKHDDEGRLITVEFEKLFVVATYVPNSGRELARLDYRTKEWDVALMAHLKRLDAIKPVVLCGDLNVAHLAIDLANPDTNERTAGFTPPERERFTELLSAGFVDTFRALNPRAIGQYSFWSAMRNARATNTGWRLDYFVVSKRLVESGAVHDSIIDSKVLGSDHAPIVLTLDLSKVD